MMQDRLIQTEQCFHYLDVDADYKRLESPAPTLCGLDHTCLLKGFHPVQEIAGLENTQATADKMHSVSPGLKMHGSALN